MSGIGRASRFTFDGSDKAPPIGTVDWQIDHRRLDMDAAAGDLRGIVDAAAPVVVIPAA